MTLWVCQSCTASYSVGASRCPQCGSDNYLEEGQEMTKANAASGTTYYVLIMGSHALLIQTVKAA